VRQPEIGVRIALGAGSWRILRLVSAENVLLAVAGSILGSAIAVMGTNVISAMPPLRVRGIPVTFHTSVDLTAVVVAILLGLACAIGFGTGPAVQLARLDPHLTLRGASSTPSRGLLRNALMAVEAGLALLVLVVAGLFIRSFLQTRGGDTGFTKEGVLLAAYDLTGRSPDDVRARTFAARVLERVSALPDVAAAAIGTSVPLDLHGMPSRAFTLEGRARSDDTLDEALANTVTPGYFTVLRIPFRSGTDFASLEDAAPPYQVIVNEEFANRYLPNMQPLGRRIGVGGSDYVIWGVVANSLYNAFGEPPTPIIYFSFRDRPAITAEIHVRTRAGVGTAVAPAIQRVVRELDPELPIYDVRTLNEHIEANLIFRRIPARMFAVLAPMLLLLAAIGVYSVVSYTVSLRTSEIGVRVALGATARQLGMQIVGDSVRLIAAGLIGGWLVAFGVAMSLSDTGTIDVAVFAGVPLLLLIVGSAAAWLPARRASLVDPAVALRQN
jgi:predicted permease